MKWCVDAPSGHPVLWSAALGEHLPSLPIFARRFPGRSGILHQYLFWGYQLIKYLHLQGLPPGTNITKIEPCGWNRYQEFLRMDQHHDSGGSSGDRMLRCCDRLP